MIKPSDIAKVHELINNFDPNIQFTIDTFKNEVPHFLDIEISPDGLTIFRKDTNTGQYVNIESYTNWNHKTAWIRSLVTRAKRIYSSNKLQLQELSKIRCFASWNAFPKHVCNGIIKKTITKLNNATTVDSSNDDNIVTLWMKIPYLGDQSQQLVRTLQRKLKRSTRKNTQFVLKVSYSTTKVSYFTNNKDRTPKLSKSGVVYQFRCPGCSADYIGKTDRNLHERCIEHATTKDSAIMSHLNTCQQLTDINNMMHFDLPQLNRKEKRTYNINCDEDNTSIIDTSDNWSILLIKEALHIKRHKPILNSGLKASRDLFLFS